MNFSVYTSANFRHFVTVAEMDSQSYDCMGTEFLLCMMEKVPEDDGSDGYATVRMDLRLLSS